MAPELAGRMATKAVAAVKPATRAYVTFLAGDGDYWKGVVGLAKGLRKVGSAYPLVVAVLPDVSESRRRILISQGCIVREIEPVYPRENQTQFAMAYYVINYSKLRIWEFVEYERMVYLDADIQVFENIDELFELEMGHFYAVMDCFCDKTWSHTPQYNIGYCQQCSDKVAWPTAELGPPPSLYFNAGMFVHEPSMATAKALLDTLRVTPPTPFAEQDFLNMFFREQYKPIPLVYNLVLAMLEKVKVMHYCATVFADNATTGAKTGSSLVQAVGRNKMAGALLAEQVRRCLPVLGIVATSTAATALATGTTTTPATGFALLVLLLGGLSLVTLGVLMDRGANGRGCDGDDVSLS